MSFKKVASAILRVKQIPRLMLMGTPSTETTFISILFGLDGSVRVSNEWGDEFTIKPLEFGFAKTVELYEDADAEVVAYHLALTFMGETFEVWVYFKFKDDPFKVKISIRGSLPAPRRIRIPFTSKFKCIFINKCLWFGTFPAFEDFPLTGVGLDCSDMPDAAFDEATIQLVFSVGETFAIDPSVVLTTSNVYATQRGFQRRTFKANGWFYVFTDDGIYAKLYNSQDGVNWTDRSSALNPYYIPHGDYRGSAFYSPAVNAIDVVGCNETSNDRIGYQRLTPNSDGSVSKVSEKYVLPRFMDEDGYEGITGLSSPVWYTYPTVLAATYIYALDRTGEYVPTDSWTTEVNIGTYGAGSFFVFTPYTSGVYVGTALPASPQQRGFVYGDGYQLPHLPKKLWSIDGRFVLNVRARNPDAIVHAGNLHARLWAADSADMTVNPVLIAQGYVSISWSGTAGETKDVTINLDNDLGVGDAWLFKGKYLYVELFWEVTTAATNARVQLNLNNGYTKLNAIDQTIYNPTVVIDSNGYPWVGFGRYNGINYYLYVLKGDVNTGNVDFRNCMIRKLKSPPGSIGYRRVMPVPLTGGKMLVIYGGTSTSDWSQYWDGTSWSAEAATGANLAGVYVACATAIGDTVHYIYCESTTYNLVHRKWDPVNGWTLVGNIISGTGAARTVVVTADPDKNELYTFWVGYPTANHVYYAKYSAGEWSTPTDWLDESAEALTSVNVPTCFFQVYENTVGLLYETKTASPYNVKFAFLTLVVPPPVGVPRYIGDGLSGVVVVI